jgi:hypothetical protein
MITFYDEKDLVTFGEYLLSKEREESLKQVDLPYEERFRVVYGADIQNWKETQK